MKYGHSTGLMKLVNIMELKAFWLRYRSFFLIFLFCASIIFYMSRKVIEKESENIKLKMEIILKDSLTQVGEGKYRKMVNYYDGKVKLLERVRKNNPEIYREIIKNNEKILSNTNLDFTFKPKESSRVLTKKDSIFEFSSYYPKKENSFIKFNGTLNTNSNILNEKWTFNNIKLDIILTEKENGLWNTYLDGPDFVVVNSMSINSLPPKEYVPVKDKVKFLNFYGGVGIRTGVDNIASLDGKDLTINGAMMIKNKVILELNMGTDKKVGTAILFKF